MLTGYGTLILCIWGEASSFWQAKLPETTFDGSIDFQLKEVISIIGKDYYNCYFCVNNFTSEAETGWIFHSPPQFFIFHPCLASLRLFNALLVTKLTRKTKKKGILTPRPASPREKFPSSVPPRPNLIFYFPSSPRPAPPKAVPDPIPRPFRSLFHIIHRNSRFN